jgi:hypothetical protein
MARILLFAPLAAAASGKLGAVKLRGKLCATTAAQLTSRTNTTNPTLQAIKGWKKSIAQAWSTTLTPAQRAAWNAAAPTLPIINSKGTTHPVTGNNLFTALNTNLHNLGLPTINTPPADTNYTDLDAITLTQPTNPTPPPPLLTDINLTTQVIPPATDYIVVKCARPRAPGATATRPRAQATLKTVPPSTPQPIQLGPAIIAKYGLITTGLLYDLAVYTIRSSNGARSPTHTAQIVLS